MTEDSTLPAVVNTAPGRVSTIAELAAIPEEEIWLSKQKSARTRRAYRLDVQHFMRTLSTGTPEELRQADHKAVIAWKRYMREVEHAASSTIRRRLAALSSLYKHLVRHSHALDISLHPRPRDNSCGRRGAAPASSHRGAAAACGRAILAAGTEGLQTRRWREPDSNRRSRLTPSRSQGRLMSPLLDPPPTEKSARTRTDSTRTPGALRGTDGSNPAPSSSESARTHRHRWKRRAE
jgi:hypothetical protein